MVGDVDVPAPKMVNAVDDKQEPADDDADLSIFTLDDFVNDDPSADTQELELTEEVVTEPATSTPNAHPDSTTTDSSSKPVETNYFSIDGDLLDHYFGKKKK
jgi:hypothetical protein